MGPITDLHTKQITVMSNQLFAQAGQLTEMQNTITLLGSQLQRTQLHISKVDARALAYGQIKNVLSIVINKVNEVIGRMHMNEELEQIFLADLESINNMERGTPTACQPRTNRVAPCDCDFHNLCDKCFH